MRIIEEMRNKWIISDYKTSYKKSKTPGIKCGTMRRFLRLTSKHLCYVTQSMDEQTWTVSIYPLITDEAPSIGYFYNKNERLTFARFDDVDPAKYYAEDCLERLELGQTL